MRSVEQVKSEFLDDLVETIEVRKIENEEYVSFLEDPQHNLQLGSSKYNQHSQVRLENLKSKIELKLITLSIEEEELLQSIITNPLFEVNEKIWN